MCNGNCTWLIIILILFCCCGGGFGTASNNNDCGCNNCGCGCYIAQAPESWGGELPQARKKPSPLFVGRAFLLLFYSYREMLPSSTAWLKAWAN